MFNIKDTRRNDDFNEIKMWEAHMQSQLRHRDDHEFVN